MIYAKSTFKPVPLLGPQPAPLPGHQAVVLPVQPPRAPAERTLAENCSIRFKNDLYDFFWDEHAGVQKACYWPLRERRDRFARGKMCLPDQ